MKTTIKILTITFVMGILLACAPKPAPVDTTPQKTERERATEALESTTRGEQEFQRRGGE